MEITLLQRNEIDINKWNACIESDTKITNVSGMSWYLDRSCDDWNAVIVGAYQSVMPLPCRKKWGMNYVYPPFFISRTGFWGQNLTVTELDMVFGLISKKFKWIDTMLSPDTEINIEHYQHLKHRAFILDLQQPYSHIQKQYHRNHQRNCRKAVQNELTLTKNPDIEEIISLFIDNIGQRKQVGYSQKDYQKLKELLVFLQSQNAVETLGANDKDGKLCAGIFFTHKDGKYNYLFSGRNEQGADNGSMFFIMDNFIALHAENAVNLYLNGSDNEQIARFYAGFGLQETYYYQLMLNRLNKLERGFLSLLRKIR